VSLRTHTIDAVDTTISATLTAVDIVDVVGVVAIVVSSRRQCARRPRQIGIRFYNCGACLSTTFDESDRHSQDDRSHTTRYGKTRISVAIRSSCPSRLYGLLQATTSSLALTIGAPGGSLLVLYQLGEPQRQKRAAIFTSQLLLQGNRYRAVLYAFVLDDTHLLHNNRQDHGVASTNAISYIYLTHTKTNRKYHTLPLVTNCFVKSHVQHAS
jgi:hypothetical protein